MEWALGWDVVGRLTVGVLLGALIGIEREVQDHPAGLRTHATVGIGAALFGVISTLGFHEILDRRAETNLQADVTRVASQVVVGVGFLGAGLIFRRGGTVRNLTTAASLWATAAVGLAAGVGDPGVAVVGAVLMLVVLWAARIPQRWLVARFGKERRHLRVRLAAGVTPSDLRAEVDRLPLVEVAEWRIEKHDGRPVVDAVVVAGSGDPIDEHLADLAASASVEDVRFAP